MKTQDILILLGIGAVGLYVYKKSQENIGIPDPAAVYCQLCGYHLVVETDANGQHGVCIFPDGNRCDSWDFFTGKCGQQYTLCEQQGGIIQTTTNNCQFSSECAECVFADGTRRMEWVLV